MPRTMPLTPPPAAEVAAPCRPCCRPWLPGPVPAGSRAPGPSRGSGRWHPADRPVAADAGRWVTGDHDVAVERGPAGRAAEHERHPVEAAAVEVGRAVELGAGEVDAGLVEVDPPGEPAPANVVSPWKTARWNPAPAAKRAPSKAVVPWKKASAKVAAVNRQPRKSAPCTRSTDIPGHGASGPSARSRSASSRSTARREDRRQQQRRAVEQHHPRVAGRGPQRRDGVGRAEVDTEDCRPGHGTKFRCGVPRR